MHNIEKADQLTPKGVRSIESLRQAIGQSWPSIADTGWEASYKTTAAPKGGMTYSAQNLGLTK